MSENMSNHRLIYMKINEGIRINHRMPSFLNLEVTNHRLIYNNLLCSYKPKQLRWWQPSNYSQ